MQKKKRLMSGMVATALMTAAVLSGCGGEDSADSEASKAPAPSTAASTAATAAASNTPDISKKVELNWYLLGAVSPDTEKVMAEANKILEKELNATIKLNFTTWTDWQTKYNLLLSSGEPVDMIFASSWADYFKYAKQGAFMDLTEMLPKYAPNTWKSVPKQDWSDVTVGGKIYAVPSTFAEYAPDGWVYREDWRKQFNLPEIKDLATLEAYMAGVKKNLPNVTPIGGNTGNELAKLFKYYTDYQPIGGDESLIGASSYGKPRDIVIYPFTQAYSDFVHMTKKWADQGFWSKDALASKENPGNMIKAGTGAIQWTNLAGASTFIAGVQKDTKGAIELGYFPFTRFHNYAMPNLSINNGMAVPRSAKNPERSLMALEKIRNDQKLYRLMTYGIEGYHYSFAENGKNIVSPAQGQDPNKVKGYSIADWGWRNETNMLFPQGGWDLYDKLVVEMKGYSKPNLFAPITLDYEPVKSELAAVNEVKKQYEGQLRAGLVKDVDETLKTYLEKLKQAGIDKVADYVKKQATSYFDEKGIK